MKFFELCKKVSQNSDHQDHRHGSCITRGNKLISVGCNKKRTHPKSLHRFKHLHAEVSAIVNAKQDLEGCSIYIYRQIKDGTPSLSRPCDSCMMLIKEVGIKKIYYSNNGSYTEELI